MGAGQTPGERGVIALYTATLSVPGGLGAGPCSEVDVKTEGGQTYYLHGVQRMYFRFFFLLLVTFFITMFVSGRR